MSLRFYQQKSMDLIRELYRKSVKKVLLKLPTGAGKTKIFCEMLKQAHLKGTPSLLIVHMNQLIRQTEERLHQEGVPFGIIQGDRTRDEYATIRVCSIQTLARRNLRPEAKFIVIDEAHATDTKSYREFLADYPDAYILAVTATPYLKSGMRHVADAVVSPIDVQGLIDLKFLVPGKYYSCPEKVDLSDVKIIGGDYQQNQLAKKMAPLVGNVVEHYKKLADGLPALMFAVNIEHSLALTKSFNESGIACAHVDANTPFDERKKIISDLENGRIKVISSIGTLTTGFDCPPTRTLIICRPTKSYNLHIQMLGRGSRPFPGKEHFIVIDHAGNTLKHGFYETDRECSLDPQPKTKNGNPDAFLVECENCFAIFPISKACCPACGHVNEKKPGKNLDHVDGELVEIQKEEWRTTVDNLVAKAKKMGYKKGWLYHKIQEKLDPVISDKAWQSIKRMKKWPTRETNPEMFTHTRSSYPRYFSETDQEPM